MLPTIEDLRALDPEELEAKRAYLEAEREAWLRYADGVEERIRIERAKLEAANSFITDLNNSIHWTWTCHFIRDGLTP